MTVRLFAPEPDGPHWDCRYAIDWPEGTVEGHAMGNDALHAQHLAQQKIGTDLCTSDFHHRAGHVVEALGGLWISCAQGCRDRLIGAGAEFYGG